MKFHSSFIKNSTPGKFPILGRIRQQQQQQQQQQSLFSTQIYLETVYAEYY